MIDLIALLLVAVWAFVGWRRGTVLTLLSGAGLVGGYLGAVLLYRPVGEIISRFSSLGPMVAYPLGGLAAMLGVALAVSGLALVVRRRRARRLADGFYPSSLDRAGGATLGGLWAIGVVALLGWGATVLQGVTGRDFGMERSVAGRVSAALTGGMIEFLARRFTGNPALADVMTVLALRPAVAVESLNQLASDPRLRELTGDRGVVEALERGDVETLMRHPVVSQLLRDPEFLRAARDLHLIDGLGANASPPQIAAQFAERVGPLVLAAEHLSHDLEVQRVLRESRLVEHLEEGRVADVLSSGEFDTLMRKFLAELRGLELRQ